VESLDAYLERLASSDPVPGGGSAAALTAALAAALVAMVARILAAAGKDVVTAGGVERANRLRSELNEARQRDETAYAGVVAAQALPKRDETERSARRRAIDAALEAAAQAPLHTAALALKVLELTDRLLEVPMGALASDVGCAAELAHAALTAAGYNVRINHRYMRDEAPIREQAKMLVRYEGEASRILARVRDFVARDSRRSPRP
jgi:formiminotetrahydrofolate cyclodeaminase